MSGKNDLQNMTTQNDQRINDVFAQWNKDLSCRLSSGTNSIKISNVCMFCQAKVQGISALLFIMRCLSDIVEYVAVQCSSDNIVY